MSAPTPPLSDGFDAWWAAHRVHRVLNPAGVARIVWEASARHNRMLAAPALQAAGASASVPAGSAEYALFAVRLFRQEVEKLQTMLDSVGAECVRAMGTPAPQATDAELERRTGEPHVDGWPLVSALPAPEGAKYVMCQALEALENSVDLVANDYHDDWRHGIPSRAAQLAGLKAQVEAHKAAIVALRAALGIPAPKEPKA